MNEIKRGGIMKHRTPLKAIRAKCLDCSGDQPKEVRLCHLDHCALYPFRFGKNPARAGIGSKTGQFEQNDGLTA